MAILLAFASPTPLLHARASHVTLHVSRKRVRPPATFIAPRACLPPEQPPKLSRTEEMALMLGKDTKKMRDKAAQEKEEFEADRRFRIRLALSSTIISTLIFFIQHSDPNRPNMLMKYMQSNSAPIEIIGTNNKPSVVEFGASWCETCKSMARDVYELENDYAGRINFIVLDGDDARNADTLERFGVDGLPQFAFVDKDGQIITNLVGKVPRKALEQELDALILEKELPFKGLSLERLFSKS